MTSHTKGPWLFRGKSNGVFTAPEAGTAYQYGELIFQFDDVAEPSDADLELVLAAPDLLAAAERYLEFRHLSDCGLGEQYSGVHPETELKAAISKAKGLKNAD